MKVDQKLLDEIMSAYFAAGNNTRLQRNQVEEALMLLAHVCKHAETRDRIVEKLVKKNFENGEDFRAKACFKTIGAKFKRQSYSDFKLTSSPHLIAGDMIHFGDKLDSVLPVILFEE